MNVRFRMSSTIPGGRSAASEHFQPLAGARFAQPSGQLRIVAGPAVIQDLLGPFS